MERDYSRRLVYLYESRRTIGFAGCAQQVKLHVEKIADPPPLFVSSSFFFSLFLYFFSSLLTCSQRRGVGECNILRRCDRGRSLQCNQFSIGMRILKNFFLRENLRFFETMKTLTISWFHFQHNFRKWLYEIMKISIIS